MCTGCSVEVPLEDCVLRPAGGFAHAALVFAGVEDAVVSPDAQQLILEVLGETRIVFKRLEMS